MIPKHFGVPYLLWTVGITPRRQWQRAEEAGRLDIDIPTNHNPGFLPDLGTLPVATEAAAVAILACLQRSWPDTSSPEELRQHPTQKEIAAAQIETAPGD